MKRSCRLSINTKFLKKKFIDTSINSSFINNDGMNEFLYEN